MRKHWIPAVVFSLLFAAILGFTLPSWAEDENSETELRTEAEYPSETYAEPAASEALPETSGAGPAQAGASEAIAPASENESSDMTTDNASGDANYEDARSFQNLHVSLDFKDAEIADVLSALAKAYDLNIIAGKEITGQVSVNLTEVSLEDALDAILELNRYTYSIRGNIIKIITESDQLTTEVFRLEFATAAEVRDLFKNVLSEYGDLRINEQLNEILITDVASALDDARELLYTVDAPPPQVVIEAKLVDIDPKDLANLGADVDINYLANLVEGAHRIDFDYNLSGPSGSLSGDDLVAKFTTPLFTPENSLTVDALLQKTKANLLSAPRIAVLNNESARIVIGEKVGIREQTQTASGTIESVRFVDVGITLNVTPQINRGGYVTMEITTEVSSVSSFVDNLPRITTREATTNVRVRDKQTVIIAGLLKDEYSETASSFPLLTHIPFIGQLLGNFANSRERKELIIFITPHVLYAATKVDPDDAELALRKKIELDSYRIKHEELMNQFRKDGIEDALDLDPYESIAKPEHYFERGTWFEHNARRRFNSRRFRKVQQRYFIEAARAYDEYARMNPDNSRAFEAMKKAAELYEHEAGQPERAYDTYRYIVTDQPGSPYGKYALSQMKDLKKRLADSESDRQKKHQKLLAKLEKMEIPTEPIGDAPHAEIPLQST